MIRLAVTGAVGAAGVMMAMPLTALTAVPAQPATGELALTLLDQRFGVEPDGSWQARFAIEGELPTDPEQRAEVRVVAHRVVEDRVELAEAISDSDTGVVDRVTTPLVVVGSGEDTTLELDVPTTTDAFVPGALTMRRAGVYPVEVQVLVDGVVVIEKQTLLERLPLANEPAPSPLRLAIVAAVDDSGPAPRSQQLIDGREQLAAVADLAAAVDGPVTLALPPVLLDDVVSGDPELADELRATLVGDEVLALPAEELDPSSAVAIDRAEVFARGLRDGEEVIETALPDVPADRSAWLTTSPVSAAAAGMLFDLGFDLLVMNAVTYSRLENNIGGFFDTTLLAEASIGDGDRLASSVVSALGARLDPVRPEALAPMDEAVRILAELVTARRELGSTVRRSVVLATPETAIPDPAVAGALAALVAGRTDLLLARLSDLEGTTDTMIVDGQAHTLTLPPTAGPDLAERAERIQLTRVSAESAGSMLPSDDALQEWRAELDGLLSTGLSDDAVDTVLERISRDAELVRSAVGLPRPFDLTLTGRSSVLRLNVRNDSTEELRVVIRASSPKLTFPDGDQLVSLAPSGVTEVEIPVEARSNGTSSIQIQVVTPAVGQRIGPPVTLTAHLNALTGLGQVITGGALLVLASWWFGHFRRRRRERLAALAAASAPPPLESLSPDAAEAQADETTELLADWEIDERRGVS